MASTSEELQQDSPKRFYCHQCAREITPKLPEFVCPRCDGGFIEELTENSEDDVAQPQPPPLPGLFELFGGRNMLFPNALPPNGATSDDDDDDLDFGASAAANPSIPLMASGHGAFPRATIAVRTVGGGGADNRDVMQSLFENLLSGLTGGGGSRNILFGGGGGAHQINFLNLGELAGNPGDYVWGPAGLDAIITQLMNQLEGTGPPPASKEKIDSLPTIIVTAEHIANNLQCSVCFDELKCDEKVNQLPCQHLYHPDCIKPWLEQHGTCPVCRKNLDGEDTTCDQNAQSIPETLENLGLNADSMSPRTSQTTAGSSRSASTEAAASNRRSTNDVPSTDVDNPEAVPGLSSSSHAPSASEDSQPKQD